MLHTIQSERMRVRIDELGAEMQSVTVDGRERLWQNEDGSWDGHAPILFPFCGNCGIVLDGTDYGRGFHGVVNRKTFSCVSKSDTSVTFSVAQDADTLKCYPFCFLFSVTYTVRENELQICYDVKNMDERTIYYACGGHESFLLEHDIDAYELVFSQAEPFAHYPHDANGRLIGERISKGSGNVVPLGKADLSNDDTLILGALRSDRVTLREKTTGKAVMEEHFSGFSNLLLWRTGNAKMVCVEPWQNLPDCGNETVEFSLKPGVRGLLPGCMESHIRTIRYL